MWRVRISVLWLCAVGVALAGAARVARALRVGPTTTWVVALKTRPPASKFRVFSLFFFSKPPLLEAARAQARTYHI